MENKNMDDMEVLNCTHILCTDCLEKILKPECPYCRLPFDNVIKNITDENTVESYNIEIDNIYPLSTLNTLNENIIHSNRRYISKSTNRRSRRKGFTSNKDREPYERKKKKWKKKNM
tara:strand:- start:256 stop:606 length:351 start_codon:yes stop_codon:yes gene_type:complete